MKLLKTQSELIAEIHQEFDTAQDRLLAEATEILSKQSLEETQVEKIAERLLAIGFTKTPVVKEAEKIKVGKKALVKTREEAELIRYYKESYPFLKFLTEKELERICDKYGLVFAPIGNYKENVPEKNIRDIEMAQPLKRKDFKENVLYFSGHLWCNDKYAELRELLDKRCKNLKNIEFTKSKHGVTDENNIAMGVMDALGIDYKGLNIGLWTRKSEVKEINMSGLFIAAPPSHFDLEGLEKDGKHGFFKIFKTEIKDPIVFRYVRGGVQVLTKWGLEANDPMLVVPADN